MDDCSRQNPAYRLAKEGAPQGAPSICATASGRPPEDPGLTGLRPLVLHADEPPELPAGEQLERLRVTGTVRSPVVTVEPLSLLTEEALRFFVNRANIPLP